jgi:hypothetical protein
MKPRASGASFFASRNSWRDTLIVVTRKGCLSLLINSIRGKHLWKKLWIMRGIHKEKSFSGLLSTR